MTDRIGEILDRVDRDAAPAAYVAAARALDAAAADLRGVRVALLSSFTIAPLAPYLKVQAARHGLGVTPYIGAFNAIHQELRQPSSGCAAHDADVVFIAHELSDVCPPLAADFLGHDAAAIADHIDRIATDLAGSISAFRERSGADIVVHTFAPPRRSALGLFEVMADTSETTATRHLNARLIDSTKRIGGVYFIDQERLVASVGYAEWYDDKWWLLARMPMTAAAMRETARTQAAVLRALTAGRRRCLAVDLDNTLWGGVVGERGVAGIDLGETYPGNAYRRFQEYLLQLHRRGVLLAIVSKNNAADVDEVFRAHPGMVLRREHFAATRVNWDPKPENLRSIAAELDLALDSFAFYDDSAVECALMRSMAPEVLTVQAPENITGLITVLEETAAFEQLSWTADDRRRGEMYRARAARSALAASVGSLDDFLHGLGMTASVRPADAFALPRIADLVAKTNQFNMTTRRYTAGELAALMAADDQDVFYLQLSDRLGDYGIVGVAAVRATGDTAHIEAFLLSCRAMGRNAETALLAHLDDYARGRGLSCLEGEFIATPRNAPAADFYARHGFACVESSTGRSRWRLTLADTRVSWPPYIQPSPLAA